MKRIIINLLVLLFLSSCHSKKYNVTPTYVYNANGFLNGFTIQSLDVINYNSKGLPKDYKEDTIRADLNYSNTGKVKKKIWLEKGNHNYYWTYMLKGKYETMPIKFVKNKWYLLWSNEFDINSGTSRYRFFIFRDSANKIKIYSDVVGKL